MPAEIEIEEEPLTVQEILDQYKKTQLHIEKDKNHNFWIDGRNKAIGGRFKTVKRDKDVHK